MSAEIAITTPGVLFSTVSLIMLAYTNRFLAISNLIRTLSETYNEKPDSHIIRQIQLLRKRCLLIKAIQMLCILALLLSIVSMLLILHSGPHASRIAFRISLVLMVASLVFAVIETALSTNALNLSIPSQPKEYERPSMQSERRRNESNRTDLEKPADTGCFADNLILNSCSN
jgi:hypothetical protein